MLTKIIRSISFNVMFIMILVAAAIALTLQNVKAAEEAPSPIPVQGLTAEELARFQNGLEIFEHRFSLQEGRGPFFNQPTCHNCHRIPTAGGFGPEYRSNIRVGSEGNLG